MSTQEVFDPYRKWLGIPESELPPSLYRLLGLVDFESDPDVICHAADRCMAHVRTFQSGARADLSQRVLNELAQARNCLLDPQRRQAYDLALRRQRIAAPPAVAPMAVPISPMAPVAVAPQPGMAYPVAGSPMMGLPVAGSATGLLDAPDLSSSRRTSSVSMRARRKSSPVPMLLTMFAVVVGLGIGLIVWLNQRNATASSEKQPVPATPQVPPTPKTYVIKRTRPDSDATGEVLTPRSDRPGGEGRTDRTSGGAPVIDVRSSDEMPERGERSEPKNAAEAIEEARTSMSRGNTFRAKRMLEVAGTFSPNEEQRQRIAILSKLQEYLHAFHVALAAGAEKLEPGRNFLIDLGSRQVPVTFVEFERQNGRRLVFESEGKRMTHRIDALPADWAMPIARPMLDAKSPASRLAIATFLAIAFNGDRDLARQMWESLITEGIADPSLARELNLPISDKIVKNSTVPAETKPVDEEKMPAKETPAGELLPVPSGTELAEAKRKFRDDYRDKISKARGADDKSALAGELVAKAAEITDNRAYRYVLQEEAIELLVDQGNVMEFVRLIDALATEYEVDALAVKAEALGKASAGASSAEQGEALYLVTAEIFSTAKELKHYDVAERLARVAAKCAERAQDRDAAEFALLEAGKMQSLHQLVSAAVAGQEKLKSDKDDAAAKTAVGRWDCFLNNNWEVGLPLLEQGNDATLAELAKADLAGPKEIAAQADLASRWLQFGKSQRDGPKAGPLSRAKHWYEQALGQANDEAKPALTKSLAEVDALLEAAG